MSEPIIPPTGVLTHDLLDTFRQTWYDGLKRYRENPPPQIDFYASPEWIRQFKHIHHL